MFGQTRLDAAQTLFFQRQLEYIFVKMVERQYASLDARKVLPMNTEVPPWATSYKYYVLDRVGQAKVISNYSTDLPTVDLIGKQVTANIYSYGASFVFNIQEIREAIQQGTNLETLKADAVARAMAELENKLTFLGDANLNLPGLLNHPNIPSSTVPAGVSASTFWGNKTPDEILKDMNDIVTAIVVNTKKVETPNTLLLPVSSYQYVNSTKVSTLSSDSILKTFLMNRPEIKEVIQLNELESMPVTGLKGMIAYTKDPYKIEMVVPLDMETFPPQANNLSFMTPVHARFGGVKVQFPLSARIAQGI